MSPLLILVFQEVQMLENPWQHLAIDVQSCKRECDYTFLSPLPAIQAFQKGIRLIFSVVVYVGCEVPFPVGENRMRRISALKATYGTKQAFNKMKRGSACNPRGFRELS